MKPPIIKIAFLNVGQADTIVISCPDTHEAIVVDCVDADLVLSYLKQEQVTYLRGVIITHLHADHYDKVAALLNNYHLVPGMHACEVLAFNERSRPQSLHKLDPDADRHSDAYQQPLVGTKKLPPSALANLVDWCKRNKEKCAEIKVEKRPLAIDGVLAQSLRLVHPYLADYSDLKATGLNNTSVVLQINGPGSSALLTGDLELKGWKQLQANHPDLRSDVLKFPHHGGAWSVTDTEHLLDCIKPSIVVISVGTEGYKKYIHPNPDIFVALSKPKHSHIRILCTQATDQCQQQQCAQNEQACVINQFKAQASKSGQESFISKPGCPCAGTVIIELADEARVLQPEAAFHQEQIIKPHFKAHKCSIRG